MFDHARYFPTQLPVLRALGRVALVSARQQAARRILRRQTEAARLPGAMLRAEVAPRSRSLVADYLRHVHGDPAAYAGVVPAHLFPQWTFPLQMRALEGIGYTAAQILNGGCRLTLNRPLPDDEPLRISVQLTDIDDDGRRAVLNQRIVIETARAPEALVIDWQGIIRLRGGNSKKKKKSGKTNVQADVTPIDYWQLHPRVGMQFALLTGDFNPVHWSPLYARVMGFRRSILHGFSCMARTMESVIRAELNHDPSRLATFECRFTTPIALPAKVVAYTNPTGGVFVGDAPDAPAYLVGSFTART